MAGVQDEKRSIGENHSDILAEMLEKAQINFKKLTTGKEFKDIQLEGTSQYMVLEITAKMPARESTV